MIFNFCVNVIDYFDSAYNLVAPDDIAHVFFTGSRSPTSHFNNRYYTLESDYDITMFLNTQFEDSKNIFVHAVASAMNLEQFDEKNVGHIGQDGFQIKFETDNNIAPGIQFDLNVRDEANYLQQWNLHISLEISLNNFRTRMTSGSFLTPVVFDVYIRTIKAIRPDGCSSLRAIMMGATALEFYAGSVHRPANDTFSNIAEQVSELVGWFFNFSTIFFAEHRTGPYWRNQKIILENNGVFTFNRVLDETAHVPQAHFRVHFHINFILQKQKLKSKFVHSYNDFVVITV